MKQRINLLILFSIIALIVLCLVQCYLVKITYNYKVAQFHTEIKDEIASITNDYSDIDSAIVHKKDLLYKQLAQSYLQNKKRKSDLTYALLHNEYRDVLTRKLQLKLEREIPDITINFAVVLNKFILYKSAQKADTLFSEKSFIKNKLYGNLVSLESSFLVRNYAGTSNASLHMQDYKLLTEDSMYVSVIEWETIILKRMRMVLILSLFSIITLITLFVITIKALIKQKKVNDVKTDFINNITHELKTPLATLGISTKILERKEIRGNEVQFNTILQTISRQNNRLQNLGDFKISNPEINITSDINAAKTTLLLDHFHLTTAIQNVLENAVKYGSTIITIKTELIQNQFNISVKDNGIGISKNKHSLLFDKFYRVEKGNLHNTKGLGLGLYYVDQIIKAHQGSIAVISDLGKGSVFTIMFKV
jgi:signal transduction histidine kinase